MELKGYIQEKCKGEHGILDLKKFESYLINYYSQKFESIFITPWTYKIDINNLEFNLSSSNKKNSSPIASIKQLFGINLNEKRKNSSKISISGKPGVGKTTFLQSIAGLWASSQLYKNGYNFSKSADFNSVGKEQISKSVIGLIPDEIKMSSKTQSTYGTAPPYITSYDKLVKLLEKMHLSEEVASNYIFVYISTKYNQGKRGSNSHNTDNVNLPIFDDLFNLPDGIVCCKTHLLDTLLSINCILLIDDINENIIEPESILDKILFKKHRASILVTVNENDFFFKNYGKFLNHSFVLNGCLTIQDIEQLYKVLLTGMNVNHEGCRFVWDEKRDSIQNLFNSYLKPCMNIPFFSNLILQHFTNINKIYMKKHAVFNFLVNKQLSFIFSGEDAACIKLLKMAYNHFISQRKSFILTKNLSDIHQDIGAVGFYNIYLSNEHNKTIYKKLVCDGLITVTYNIVEYRDCMAAKYVYYCLNSRMSDENINLYDLNSEIPIKSIKNVLQYLSILSMDSANGMLNHFDMYNFLNCELKLKKLQHLSNVSISNEAYIYGIPSSYSSSSSQENESKPRKLFNPNSLLAQLKSSILNLHIEPYANDVIAKSSQITKTYINLSEFWKQVGVFKRYSFVIGRGFYLNSIVTIHLYNENATEVVNLLNILTDFSLSEKNSIGYCNYTSSTLDHTCQYCQNILKDPTIYNHFNDHTKKYSDTNGTDESQYKTKNLSTSTFWVEKIEPVEESDDIYAKPTKKDRPSSSISHDEIKSEKNGDTRECLTEPKTSSNKDYARDTGMISPTDKESDNIKSYSFINGHESDDKSKTSSLNVSYDTFKKNIKQEPKNCQNADVFQNGNGGKCALSKMDESSSDETDELPIVPNEQLIASLSKKEEDIYENTVTYDYSSVKFLPNLKILNIIRCTTPMNSSFIPILAQLFYVMPNLQILDLSMNNLSETFSHVVEQLYNLSNLRVLRLNNCSINAYSVNNSEMNRNANFPHLKCLDISSNPITSILTWSNHLRPFSSITTLNLSKTKCKDIELMYYDLVEAFHRLNKLNEIDLSETVICKKLVTMLIRNSNSIRSVKSLNISHCYIKNSTFINISQLLRNISTNITKINLSSNNLSDDHMVSKLTKSLSECKKLLHIDMSYCMMNPDVFMQLINMALALKLEYCDLSNNKLAGYTRWLTIQSKFNFNHELVEEDPKPIGYLNISKCNFQIHKLATAVKDSLSKYVKDLKISD
ncbi:hypothetical protein A3Q56_03061 [Intoshia linei]|uniref:Uncharacterized protein n=1 Tax=Intoshia linei TaxID=1819745 RepID=A0A177B4I3_9BILA|nr:hypothetical protein A3Q56_03061 [Intoshia linei]